MVIRSTKRYVRAVLERIRLLLHCRSEDSWRSEQFRPSSWLWLLKSKRRSYTRLWVDFPLPHPAVRGAIGIRSNLVRSLITSTVSFTHPPSTLGCFKSSVLRPAVVTCMRGGPARKTLHLLFFVLVANPTLRQGYPQQKGGTIKPTTLRLGWNTIHQLSARAS